MADASLDPLRAEFVEQALAEGMTKSATLSALRELGAGMGYGRFSALWDVTREARAAEALQRSASVLQPAIEGLTAPTEMKIATDYLYTVHLEGAGGRSRSINVAVNEWDWTAQDIVNEALRVANDRSRYSAKGQIPDGGWTTGHIEAGWHRPAA